MEKHEKIFVVAGIFLCVIRCGGSVVVLCVVVSLAHNTFQRADV